MGIFQLPRNLYKITPVTATSRSGWVILPGIANGSGCLLSSWSLLPLMLRVICVMQHRGTATYFTGVGGFVEFSRSSNPLTVFRCVRKIAESNYYLLLFSLHVRPSVRMEQLGSHWTDFHEIWNLCIFWKYVKEIQVSLKSDKNYGYLWRPIYINENISLNSSSN
jgi:hypothetical protein